jgi:hypothetical protein
VLVYTLGFVDRSTLLFKFDKHVVKNREFAYTTPDEYETHADFFNGGPKDPDTLECHRQNQDNTTGDQVRYNITDERFGILSKDKIIRSYYIPNPRRHGKATNRIYYEDACLENRA